MSRLTKWLDDKKAICIKECEKKCVDGNVWCPKCKPLTDVLIKLADYEDKEEQGLLIELPVAIGEEVYCIKNMIDGYEICKNRVLSYQTAPKEVGGIVVRGYMGVTLGIVGKNVFATESEAEEALAKMGGSRE
jgi:hypothetical protein